MLPRRWNRKCPWGHPPLLIFHLSIHIFHQELFFSLFGEYLLGTARYAVYSMIYSDFCTIYIFQDNYEHMHTEDKFHPLALETDFRKEAVETGICLIKLRKSVQVACSSI